jgi:hypothetical protein
MLMRPIGGWRDYLRRLRRWRRAWNRHARADLTPLPLLFEGVGAYLVIYRVERRPIDIVAIAQGSRDIPAFLRGGAPGGQMNALRNRGNSGSREDQQRGEIVIVRRF